MQGTSMNSYAYIFDMIRERKRDILQNIWSASSNQITTHEMAMDIKGSTKQIYTWISWEERKLISFLSWFWSVQINTGTEISFLRLQGFLHEIFLTYSVLVQFCLCLLLLLKILILTFYVFKTKNLENIVLLFSVLLHNNSSTCICATLCKIRNDIKLRNCKYEDYHVNNKNK